MSDPILPTATELARHFDPRSFQRGRRLVRDAEITSVDDVPGGCRVKGRVEGTHVYDTAVTFRSDDGRISVLSSCSCPVAGQCKHGVGLALLFLQQRTPVPASLRSLERDDDDEEGSDEGHANVLDFMNSLRGALPSTPARPGVEELRRRQRAYAWSEWFSDLSHELTGGEQHVEPSALALRMEVTPAAPSRWIPDPPPHVDLTPLKQGKRGWIKTGAGWGDLSTPWKARGFVPEQAEAVARLGEALHMTRNEPARLHDLSNASHSFWAALRQVLAAGVELIPGGIAEHVEVMEEPLDVALALLPVHRPDAEEEPDTFHPGHRVLAEAGDVRAVFGVAYGEHVLSGRSMLPLGARMHGVALMPQEATSAALVLAPLRRHLSERATALLREGTGAVIPAEQREEFTSTFLPQLAPVLPVSSPDPELVPAPLEPPELMAHVRYYGVKEAELRFGFRYRAGSRTADVGLHRGSSDGAVVRQTEHERRLLQDFTPGPAAKRLLDLGPDTGSGLPAGTSSFTGERLVALSEQLLPELSEQMSVNQVGDVPEFYRLEGEPEIGFEAVDAPESGQIDWLDLRVTVTVDGEQVPLPELLVALSTGAPVVILPSGGVLPTDHPAFARLAQLVSDAASLGSAQQDRLRVAAGDAAAWAEVEEIGAVPEAAAAWVRAARAVIPGAAVQRVDAVGVSTSLRPYQQDGLDWLGGLYRHGLGGILADDMGLGKTLQTLALISTVRSGALTRLDADADADDAAPSAQAAEADVANARDSEGEDVSGTGTPGVGHRDEQAPFLIVAPTSVVPAWALQSGQHTPGLRVTALTSTTRKTGEPLAARVAGADVVVTSYTLLRHDADEYAELAWSGLVLDEAQAIKNAASKTFKAARALRSPFVIAVTGTPFENRLTELWPLLAVTAPGLYPRLEDFKRAVSTPVEKDGDAAALARLRRRLRPFLLRRTKELVAADLPEKQEEVLPVDLVPTHRRYYDTLLQRERKEVLGLVEDMDRNRVAIFASLTRLRRAALHTSLVENGPEGVPSAKVAELLDRLTELAEEGHRALVFSQFTSFLGLIRDELTAAGIRTVYLDGSTRDRGRVLEEFRDGEAPVFLISLKAGGTGLTLTEADYVFVMDPWWNPAVEAQAVDRAHRIGQTRKVMVYRLVAEGTIEEKVMALKERKAALFDQVIGEADPTPHALDADDVRELFA